MKPSAAGCELDAEGHGAVSAVPRWLGVMAPKIVQGQLVVTPSLAAVVWMLPESSMARAWIASGPVPVRMSV